MKEYVDFIKSKESKENENIILPEDIDYLIQEMSKKIKVSYNEMDIGQAFYSPAEHTICIQKRTFFTSPNEFVATAFHEL